MTRWLAAAVLLGAPSLDAASGRPDPKPCFILILSDDQRADALGCAGNPHIRTPNLDALAARGRRFTNAFVTCSICSPSRAACLTGLYGSVNGVMNLGGRLRRPGETYAQALRAAGYRTGHVGKWHLANRPEDCGFDRVACFEANGPYRGRKVAEQGKARVVEGFIDEYVADQSIAFLEESAKSGAPFVLSVCTQAPHMAWDPRPETLALYDAARLPVPPTWKDGLAGKPPYLGDSRFRRRALQYGYDHEEGIRGHLRAYYAAITDMDAALGRVFKAVETTGLAGRTTLVFMGDNGWAMGDHGLTSKVLPYEPMFRVPLIVAGPGVRAGVDHRLVLNIDAYPTLLELAGLRAPRRVHGASLVPLLQGREDAPWREAFLYEAPVPELDSRPLLAVRTARWKYIRTLDPDRPGQPAWEELYDLEGDPGERVNLALRDAPPAALAAMRDRLEELKKGVAE